MNYHLKYSSVIIVFLLSLNKELSAQTKFNEYSQIACHNCFEPQYSNNLADALMYTNTLEIDIWDNSLGSGVIGTLIGSTKMDHDWFVKHDIDTEGNLNSFGGTFKKCLGALKSWSDENKGHPVITVFVDKKENWSDNNESRKPSDLDSLLNQIFKEKLFKPNDLQNAQSHFDDKRLRNDWPNIDDLKDRIIFVLTKGTEWTSQEVLNKYIDETDKTSVCFIAPEVEVLDGKSIMLVGISEKSAKKVAIVNLPYKNLSFFEYLKNENYLLRIYNAPENQQTFDDLKKIKINFIAYRYFKVKY